MPDMKMQDMKMTDKNDGRTRSFRRTNRVLTVCKFLNPKHRNTLCIRFHTGVCSSRQIKPIHSAIIFDIFRIGVGYREAMPNCSCIQPQTFAASESVSYPALLCPAISCPAISCPAHWSVNFTSVIFTSSFFSAPERWSSCDIA